MNIVYSLLLCLVVGLVFLLGNYITSKFKDKDRLNKISIGLAFTVMMGLIIFDLIPELIDFKYKYSYIVIIIFTILGLLMLKLLDLFVPHHHHEHHDNEKNKIEHISHVKHIGKITLVSLILHNLVEGMAIYGVCINNIKSGLLIVLSVCLHNIPLGTHIFSSINKNENKLLIISLSLSSLIGGIIFYLVGNINKIFLSIIMAFTLGMLGYLTLFEFLPEIKNNYKNKNVYFGISIGLLLVLMMVFI